MNKFVLQMNDSGSWRNVVRFDSVHGPDVEAHARALAIVGGVRGMRIVHSGIVVRDLNMATHEWEYAG